MLTILKLGLLMLSNFGYWEYFRSRKQIGVYFLPAFTIAVQFSALFIAGLLNLLWETTVVLYALGLILAACGLCKEKWKVVCPYLNWGYIFLLAAMAVLAVELHNVEIGDPDSVHHWSLVTNTMLLTNRYPNFMDTVITFQGYPLGSATCIYYFCALTSRGEDIQLLAQAFLMLCMILPIFTYIRRNQLLGTCAVVFLANFLLCYNNDIRDLRVDTLLPLVGATALLFVYENYWKISDTERRIPVYYLIPFLCLSAQIKNSGLFFSLAAVMMLLVAKAKERENLLALLTVSISPVMTSLLWKKHCDYVYRGAAYAKHSMSSDWYGYVLSEKTAEDYLAVIRGVAEYTLRRADLKWILLWLVIMLVFVCLSDRKRLKHFACFIAAIGGLYVTYMAGIAGMYIFSMPKQEALSMGDILRYTRTIDVAIYCLLLCYGLHMISKMDSKRLCTARSAILLLTVLICWRGSLGNFDSVFQEKPYNSGMTLRMEYQLLLEEYGVQPGYSYLVLEPYDIYEDSYFYIKYLLNTGEVYTLDVKDVSQLEKAKECQYIFVFDYENPIVEQWVRENHPNSMGKPVIYNF